MGPIPADRKPTAILFVCLGNICRSAMAEGIFRTLATARGCEDGLIIDSAGTGNWHVGKPPDSRAVSKAHEHGIDISGQRGRQVAAADFDRFDLVLAMDRANLETLRARAPAVHHAHLQLFMSFASGRDVEVPDPYYGGPGGFEQVYRMIEAGGTTLLDRLQQK